MPLRPVLALVLVAYRTTHDRFAALTDLARVPGIDESWLDERKDSIVFAGE